MKKRLLALIVAMFCLASNLMIATAETTASADESVAAAEETKRRYLFELDFNDYTTEELFLDKNVGCSFNDGTIEVVNYVDVDPESYVGKVLKMDYNGESTNYTCFPFFRYSMGETVNKGKAVAEFEVLVSSASNDQFTFLHTGSSALGASFSDRKVTLINMDVTSPYILPAMEWVNIQFVADFTERLFSVIVNGETVIDNETIPDAVTAIDGFGISCWAGGGKPMTFYIKKINCYTEEVKTVKVEQQDTIYTEPVGLLNGLGILKDSDDYSLTAPVSRGRFAQLMTRSMGFSEDDIDSYGDTTYTDVGPENPYKRSVGYLDALGWVHSEDRKFYPDNTITFAQAAKWMTYLIGYDVLAERKGGYPVGYISILSELGVLNGINLSSNTVMTEGDTFILLSKLLEAEVIKPVAYGDEIEFRSGEGYTALWEYFKTYKIRGVVTATEDTGLATASGAVAKNYIQIDGKNYALGELPAKDVIGRRVNAYVRESKDGSNPQVVYFAVDKKRNEQLAILDDSIISVTESGNEFILQYEEEDGTTETITLSKNAYYLYNDVAYGDVIPVSELKPVAGDVLCIDNDKDGTYDVISISNYTYMAIKNVDSILDKIYGQKGETITIDNHTYLWDGTKAVELKDLAEWDVLQVRRNLKGGVELLVLTDTIRGIVEVVSDNEITVDGVVYPLSPALTQTEKDSIVAGNDLYAVLDTRGRICVIDDEMAGADDIGYLMALDEADAFGKARVKIMMKNGSINIYDISPSFRYNNVKLSQIKTVQKIDVAAGAVLDVVEGISNLGDYDKLVKLLTVDSFKKQIAKRTPESIQTMIGNGQINPTAMRQIVKYRVGTNKTLASLDTESLKVDKPVGYDYAYSYDQSGRVVSNYASIGTDGVPTFFIPPEGSADKDYRAVDWSSSGDIDNIYPEAYNLSAALVPEAMLFYGTQTTTPGPETILVERSYITRNDKGEAVRGFEGYERGIKKKFIAMDETIGADVRAGDVVRIRQNAKKEVSRLDIALRASDNPDFMQDLNNSAWLQLNYGVVMGVEKGGFAIATLNEGTATNPIPKQSGIIPFTLKASTRVYMYDLTRNKLYIGTSADVANYTFDRNPGARVLSRCEAGVLSEVFIFFRS